MKPRLLLTLFEGQTGSGRRERLCAALRQAVPSSRDLAQDLGLSRVTVEAAYAQLETEGYLRRQVGQGSFSAIDMGAAATRAAVHAASARGDTGRVAPAG